MSKSVRIAVVLGGILFAGGSMAGCNAEQAAASLPAGVVQYAEDTVENSAPANAEKFPVQASSMFGSRDMPAQISGDTK